MASRRRVLPYGASLSISKLILATILYYVARYRQQLHNNKTSNVIIIDITNLLLWKLINTIFRIIYIVSNEKKTKKNEKEMENVNLLTL
jgi:cell shape-determining protein MreD